jgi:FkbM family methyltransferase
MEMRFFIYDSPVFKTFLEDNAHERGEVKFLNSLVEEGMKVIDIGSNIGISSVTIAKKIGKRGKLYSFEPVSDYFDILKKNISSNGLGNVKLYEIAVTDQVGRADFYRKGLSSGIVSEEGVGKFEVSTTTVDRFLSEEKLEKIDLINMDCEGSELLVIMGAKETLRKNKVKIFCEIHHDFLKQLGQSIGDIVKYLQKLGFKVQSVCLDDLSMGNDFEKCEYIYAYK